MTQSYNRNVGRVLPEYDFTITSGNPGYRPDPAVAGVGALVTDTDSGKTMRSDGSTWSEFGAGGGSGAFESDGGVVKQTGPLTDDFVVGSPQLDDDTDPNHDARMFFDKAKGAFRAGKSSGNEWDSTNVGSFSHAEGTGTTASGDGAHAEGVETTASGDGAHAEGVETTASGDGAHAEGVETTASGNGSHSGGLNTEARSFAETAIGYYNVLRAQASTTSWNTTDTAFVIGGGTSSVAADIFRIIKDGTMLLKDGLVGVNKILDDDTMASDDASALATQQSIKAYVDAHSGGGSGGAFEAVSNVVRQVADPDTDDFVVGSPQLDDDSGTTDYDARMFFDKSKGAFRAGRVTGDRWDDASRGLYSSATGDETRALGESSSAEGVNTTASGTASRAEGVNTTASGTASHAEGDSSSATEQWAHAEGTSTHAEGWAAHAEGGYTYAKQRYSHAEGYDTEADGWHAHSEGDGTKALGNSSHAEGIDTTADGFAAHAEGMFSKTSIHGSHVSASGKFSTDGSAQFERVVVREDTTDATQTELLAGSSPDLSHLDLPVQRAIRFTAYVVGTETSDVDNVASYKIEGLANRTLAGASSLKWSSVTTEYEDASLVGCDVSVAVNSDRIEILVTGLASTNMNWVATVFMTTLGV